MTDEPVDKRVDSDWKRRAQMEKAQLDAQQRASAPRGGGGPPPEEGEEDEDASPRGRGSIFAQFVDTLAAQAAMFLGLEPEPMSGARRASPEQAKYLIDVLGMLDDKTRGNLSPDEDHHLKMVLHELRMAYVELAQAAARRLPPQPPPPRR